jgi:DNA modification methylase
MSIEVIKGDCLEVMKSIPEGSIDAIITDPPYGTTACKWDSVIPFDLMWEQLNRIIKPNGAIVLFGSEPFSSALRMSNIKNYKYDWKWDKKQGGNPLNAKRQPLKTYEDVLVFNKRNYYPIMEKRGKPRKKGGLTKQPEHTGKVDINYSVINNDYYPRAILEISNAVKKGKVHPTQKPVALMEYLIKTYTNENETVLDFTMGSGTTGVACKNTNRNFIGIEMDENYFNIASDRIKQLEYKLL